MSAVKPHLDQEGENSELQRKYWTCTGSGSGLGDIEESCPAPEEIVQEAHAELLSVAWIRESLIEKFQNRQIWIEYSDNVPRIAVSRPVGGPAWNPSSGSNSTTILGWTTKMGAPSFSLPAGAASMGGACPGAIAGQSIVPREARKGPARRVLEVLNTYRGPNPVVDSLQITKAICEFCYAEGGQYATSGVQNAQLVRYAWARRAIHRPGKVKGVSEFYSVMLDAIENADFKRGQEPEHFRNKRFFRIHDSGDFFSPDYFKEWKKITLYFHHKVGGSGLTFDANGNVEQLGKGHPDPIWFWAPTRIWCVPGVSEAIKANARYGDNFAVRPSAYHINQHGPRMPQESGMAAPSTVYDKDTKAKGLGTAYDWDCKAYAAEKGPSCRGAKSNPKGPGKGKEGCRECWLNHESAVNYTLHL